MGTEIILFGPKRTEKMKIKDFNLYSEIITGTTFYMQSEPQKIRLCFGGP